MINEYQIIFPIALSLLVAWAIANDAYSYRIPNAVNLAIILLYPMALILSDAQLNWQSSLIAFALVFAVGFALFVANIMGGGDVKMLAALALWLEYGQNLLNFFLIMSILGGVLTLFLIAARKYAPYLANKMGKDGTKIPQIFSYDEPIPYGIAIGATFLWLLWVGRLPIYHG